MQVGIGKHCDAREVQAALAVYFLGVSVFVYPSPEAFQDSEPEGSINAVLFANPSEFPVLLEVFPDPVKPQAVYRAQVRLARFLSERLSCRTICDGSEHGDSAAPYWSVVWEDGFAWLANDCGSVFVDGEGGPVRLVRRLETAGLDGPTGAADRPRN